MCGIAGLRVSAADAVGGRTRVEAALERLAWRGPDSQQVVAAGDWIVGVARLAISDPAHGQPIVRDAVAVAFNGHVPDAAAERSRLGANGWPTQTGNDAELLLGRLAVDRLPMKERGHHAFGIVGPGVLWLGRDARGEKPLWVARDADGVVDAWASTLPALACLVDGLDVQVRGAALRSFFRFGWCLPGPFTADRARVVEMLPPGLWRGGVGGVLERVDPATVAPPRTESVAEAIASSAHRYAFAPDVPVGLALSGGLDSACLAAALGRGARDGPPPTAWSFVAAGEPEDERRCAIETSRRAGLDVECVDAGPEVLQALPRLTALHGLPIGDPSTLAVHALAREANARRGVRVLLSGEGADEVFGGYARQRAMVWLGLLPQSVARWLRFGRWPFRSDRNARFARALGRSPTGAYTELLSVVAPAVLEELGVVPFAERFEVPGEENFGGVALAVDRNMYLPWDLLTKVDVATMAAGVESRCPYLDPDVWRLAVAQPASIGGTKRALRSAFAGELPRSVLRARKRGFSVPLDRWIREDSFIADVLRSRQTLERGAVSGAGLTRVLDRHRAGSIDAGHALYLVAAFELFCRDASSTRG